jgi:hypothetical protein
LKRAYLIPLYLVAFHTLLVAMFLIWNTTDEVGAAWEAVFGTIDFIVYFAVGIPGFVSKIGVSPSGSWAYALWFATGGAIQWFALGLGIWRLLKVRRDDS